MRKYSDSDIFIRMNTGNAIQNQLANALKSIDEKVILNDRLKDSLEAMNRAYRESITTQVSDAVRNYRIIVVAPPIDKRFPAIVPYLRAKRNGVNTVIVDISKYVVIKRNGAGDIEELKIDIPKLYNMLVPAYIALEVLNEETVISTETMKNMAFLWAKMFNKVLMGQKIFVGNQERYAAFMYFAIRFFLIYYMQAPLPVVDNIANQYIDNVKSKYIQIIEANLKQKQIDLYKDWTTFAFNMFSNEITNIHAITNVDMTVDQYLRLFGNYMGRDSAFLSLWSADYFFFCIFNAYNKSYIVNDRAWSSIVDENPKTMPRILSGLYKEL